MGFPNCVGIIVSAVEGTNMFVKNKGGYWLVLQSLMDHRSRFMNTHIYCTYRVCNARTLDIWHLSGNFSPPSDVVINKVQVLRIILGASAYPLLSWLMKLPGQHRVSQKIQLCFQKLKSGGGISEFGRLKARCYQFPSYLDANIAKIICITVASGALHNTCKARAEYFHMTAPYNEGIIDFHLLES